MNNLKDIYFTKEYGLIYEKNNEGKLQQFFLESKKGKVIYNFLKRKIDIIDGLEVYDIVTPYGYGGPLFLEYRNEDLEDLIIEFKQKFEKYCKENNIVSEFIRFHPLIENHKNMDLYMEVVNVRETICLELDGYEHIWSNISSKCRNMIRKAQKNNVEIFISENKDDLYEFIEIYTNTMKKNNALDYYFFQKEFFENTYKLLEGNIKIFRAIYNGKCISSALIMAYGDYLHYHFSGSDINYGRVAANNLLLYEVAIWGFKNGFKYLHLGGGYSGDNDSLFKFKKSFAKNENKKFYIGKKIHIEKIYNELVDMRMKINGNVNKNYFPEYRG
ncbi:Uncharacterized protein involved in methicillin resistance [[Clostridium] sordellii]|uniref:Uncharacterized protein involved in methicillin resistance n=1 Tax=Paraclostridium sordellii TaxID=1505 RepID=A0A0C7R5K2_PARSO|nr:GNAT family N-acetyltransferase [Paeniclostridium sordellii]CEQ04533.1 Uncharacterized protein involved in methicillin resistance [[Clostridium] sordellii] [Paeniclostridium sordellii]